MADKPETQKYIRCTCCKCKYINDDDHISVDFKYNRLNERYKTCVKCRTKKIKHKSLDLKTESKNIRNDDDQISIEPNSTT